MDGPERRGAGNMTKGIANVLCVRIFICSARHRFLTGLFSHTFIPTFRNFFFWSVDCCRCFVHGKTRKCMEGEVVRRKPWSRDEFPSNEMCHRNSIVPPSFFSRSVAADYNFCRKKAEKFVLSRIRNFFCSPLSPLLRLSTHNGGCQEPGIL